MKTNLNSAYIAGFFDAEGSVSIKRFKTNTNDRYELYLSLANVDKCLLQKIRKRFYSFGSIAKMCGLKYEGQRPTYEWRLESRQAGTALQELSPFLIIKRSEAELGIKFQDSLYRTGGKRLTKLELTKRQRMKERLTNLHGDRKIKIIPKKRTETLIYLAGLFDGDGSISVLHNTTITMVLTSKDKFILEYLLKYFKAGFIYDNTGASRWIVSSHHARLLLHELLPFLIIKKREAKVAVNFQDSINPKNSHPVSAVKLNRRKELAEAIKSYHLTKGAGIKKLGVLSKL